MEGDDYVGHCVNVASWLCDLAGAGEALVAPSVMEELPELGVALDETSVTLRGVEKAVPVTDPHGRRRQDTLHDPICGLPLTHDTAEERPPCPRGGLFCSPGCAYLAPTARPHRRRFSDPGAPRHARAQVAPSLRVALISH